MASSGCLIANVNGEFLPLMRCSNAVGKEFGHAARRLQAAVKRGIIVTSLLLIVSPLMGLAPPYLTKVLLDDVLRRREQLG